MCLVKQTAPVKDIGPSTQADCTESRGGPNGAIPEHQNQLKTKTVARDQILGFTQKGSPNIYLSTPLQDPCS